MEVTVYRTKACPYCNMLEDYLKQRDVGFSVKHVDASDHDREEMVKVSEGFLGVPFTTVKDGDKLEIIMGFDKGKLSEVLKLD